MACVRSFVRLPFLLVVELFVGHGKVERVSLGVTNSLRFSGLQRIGMHADVRRVLIGYSHESYTNVDTRTSPFGGNLAESQGEQRGGT